MAEEGGEQRDVKPGEQLTVSIKDQSGEMMHFKIKKTTKMSKVFDAYASRKGQARPSLRFMLDGRRVTDEQTPGELGLEDGDQLDAVMEQTGGSF